WLSDRPVFPYTTLFRACSQPGVENPDTPEGRNQGQNPSKQRQQERLEEQLTDDPQASPSDGHPNRDLPLPRHALDRDHARQVQADRKSTRLNSSHVKTS